VLVDQPVVDSLYGVPLLAGRVQVRAQMVVDDRLERVQFRGRGGIGLRGAGHADSAEWTVRRLT
jgi:hypothetical protein